MAAAFSVTVDQIAQAAYVRFSDVPIAKTDEYNDEINVDLDQFDVVVGIEVLDRSAVLPVDDLCMRYHIERDKAEVLKTLEPTIRGFIASAGSGNPRPTSASSRATEQRAGTLTC